MEDYKEKVYIAKAADSDESTITIEATQPPVMPQDNSKTFLITCITFFCILISFMALRVSFQYGVWDFLGETGGDICWSVISQIIVMLLVPIIVFSIYRKQKPVNTFKQFGFRQINKKVLGLSFAAGGTAFIFNIFVATIFASVLALFGYRFPSYGESGLTGGVALIFGLIFTGVLPGVCEEVTHRGMLLRGLQGKLGLRGALIFSSLLFGLMHLNIAQFFFTFILGLMMGMATIATKSIWPAIIMHFCNNGIGKYLEVAASEGWFLGKFYDVLNDVLMAIPFNFFVIIFIAIGLGYLLLKIIRSMVKYSGLDAGTAFALLQPVKKPKLTLWEGMFFYGTIVMGVLATVFTFVWGML